MESMESQKPASPTLAYGWKMAKIPHKSTMAASGWSRRRIVRAGEYEAICSQKTPRKKFRNESKISMKKYHHRPTLGVKSGSRRREA